MLLANNNKKGINLLTIKSPKNILPHELRVLAQNALTQLSLSPFSYAMFSQSPSEQAFINQFKLVLFKLEKLAVPAHELQVKTRVD